MKIHETHADSNLNLVFLLKLVYIKLSANRDSCSNNKTKALFSLVISGMIDLLDMFFAYWGFNSHRFDSLVVVQLTMRKKSANV